MNIQEFDPYRYYSEKEQPDGEYWQLLEFDATSINYIGLVPLFHNILANIQNPILLQALKDKLVPLLDLQSSYFFDYLNPKIFSQHEIMAIVQSALNLKLNNYSGDIPFFKLQEAINLIQRIENVEWQRTEFDKIFCLLESQHKTFYPSRSKALSNLLLSIKDGSIREEFLKKYSKDLSQEYLDLIRIQGDPEYISKKAQNFRNISIGIAPQITIGAEIELNHKTFGTFGFQLASQTNIGKYYSSSDATVPNGDEFVSPKFHDIPEELSVFCAVCDTLKELGYEAYDINVAGQINIGIDYLDTAESLLQFWELFCNCEELLYHICNPEGSIMRQSVYNNSRFKAISGKIGTQTIPEDITRDEVIKMLSPDNSSSLPGLIYKKNSICLRDKNRFEIRIPNGSEDFMVWIDNIRLFAKMVEISKVLSNVLEGKDTSETSLQKLELKESLKDESLTLEEKLFILMDILFDDDHIKEIYVNRFYALEAEILRTGTRKYEPVGLISDTGFGVVDFQRQYHSQINRSEDGSLSIPSAQATPRISDYYR